MDEASWPPIAVLGAGAVGCYFGGMLARAGAPVTLIGRPRHVEAIRRNGLFLDGLHFQQAIPLTASTEIEAIRPARLILLCVKTPDTEAAARSLIPHLAGGAIVVSLQNGVDNAIRIRSATPIEPLAAVVYVAAEMTAPGRVKHSGRGDLIVGDCRGKDQDSGVRPDQVQWVAGLFTRADVLCRISDNIEGDLWTKLIMNCACNAISALSRARYGRMAANPWTRQVMRQVVEEAIAVARAAGVDLGQADLVQAAWELAETMSGATSSTAQDLARGKPTEIDALNGYVAHRGAELGIATPVNQTLHALVKLLEEERTSNHKADGPNG